MNIKKKISKNKTKINKGQPESYANNMCFEVLGYIFL